MLININTFPDFSLPKNVKDYEGFSFVTGEKPERGRKRIIIVAVWHRQHRGSSRSGTPD
jgi:hypothetical protein